MGVPKENKQSYQNWVQVQTKATTESKDYWPQVFSFILGQGWELVSESVPGILPLKVVMIRCQCPKKEKQRAGDSAADCHLIAMTSFQSLPSLSTVNLHNLPQSLYTKQKSVSSKVSNHAELNIRLDVIPEGAMACILYFYPA